MVACQEPLGCPRGGGTRLGLPAPGSDASRDRVQARQFEWAKAHEEHTKVEEMAQVLAAKLEAIEKDKEAHRRRLQVSAVAPAPRQWRQPLVILSSHATATPFGR